MMVLISYDVSTADAAGKTRLRKVAKECQNHAQRVQKRRVEHVGAKETYDSEGVIIL